MVYAEDMTNYYGGVITALRILKKKALELKKQGKNLSLVSFIVLVLSDGHANSGKYSRTPEIVSNLRKFIVSFDAEGLPTPSVHSIGFGSNVSEDLLRATANIDVDIGIGDGQYKQVFNADELPGVFGELLGGAFISQTARDINIKFSVHNGAVLNEVKTFYKVTEDDDGRPNGIQYRSLLPSESRDALLSLTLPAEGGAALVVSRSVVTYVTASLTYTDHNGKEVTKESVLSIGRVESPVVEDMPENISIVYNQYTATNAMKQARIHAEASNYGLARKVLEDAIEVLKASPSASTLLVKSLITRLEHLVPQMSDQLSFVAMGRTSSSAMTQTCSAQRGGVCFRTPSQETHYQSARAGAHCPINPMAVPRTPVLRRTYAGPIMQRQSRFQHRLSPPSLPFTSTLPFSSGSGGGGSGGGSGGSGVGWCGIGAPPGPSFPIPIAQIARRNPRNCPGKHGMVWFTTPKVGYTCDLCNKKILKALPARGCRKCDYDICEACASTSPPICS